MLNILVLQSYKPVLKDAWIKKCIESVQNWAEMNDYQYQYIGDELFTYVSTTILTKTENQRVIATDLARLKVIQDYLQKDYDKVIWCDADFLIFAPQKFILPDSKYALGREVWIQVKENSGNNSKKLTAYTKVHNAFMMFSSGNSFLDFYCDTAENLLIDNNGKMPPQFIGPKLLTAIHNVVQCPVLETAGMLSPLVIKDIAKGGGAALKLFKQKSPQPISAANLCNSLFEGGEYSANTVEKCINALKQDKDSKFYV